MWDCEAYVHLQLRLMKYPAFFAVFNPSVVCDLMGTVVSNYYIEDSILLFMSYNVLSPFGSANDA